MKVLIVSYRCPAGKRDEFLAAIQAEGLDQASREETGNLRYDYFRADADEDLLVLLETWKDEEAFSAHCKAPHFKRIGELKEEFGVETTMEQYQAD